MSNEVIVAVIGFATGAFSGSVAAWLRGRNELEKLREERKDLLADRTRDAIEDLRAAAAALVTAMNGRGDFTGLALRSALEAFEAARSRIPSGSPLTEPADALSRACAGRDKDAAGEAARKILNS